MTIQPITLSNPDVSRWPDAPSEFGHGAVSTWMRALVGSITEDTPLREAVELMNSANVDHLVVVDDEGRLAGLMGYRDLVGLVANGAYEGPAWVGEILNRAPVTTAPDTAFAAALRLLDPPEVTCVVIVQHGRPVGVISDTHLAAPSLELVAASL